MRPITARKAYKLNRRKQNRLKRKPNRWIALPKPRPPRQRVEREISPVYRYQIK